MSIENSANQIHKLITSPEKTKAPLQTYEYAKDVISKQIETIKEELNRTEIEWLNLCNLAKQSKVTTHGAQPVVPLFKDAAELNAVPLPLQLESFHSEHQPSQHDEEDEEYNSDE